MSWFRVDNDYYHYAILTSKRGSDSYSGAVRNFVRDHLQSKITPGRSFHDEDLFFSTHIDNVSLNSDNYRSWLSSRNYYIDNFEIGSTAGTVTVWGKDRIVFRTGTSIKNGNFIARVNNPFSGSRTSISHEYEEQFKNEEEPSESKVLVLYPNPVNKTLSLKIDLSSVSVQNVECTIYDYSGRICSKGILKDGINEIKVQDLEKGSYFLEVNGGVDEILRFRKN